jgi:amidohydrolase
MTAIALPTTEGLRRLVEAELPDLVSIRHALHANPALASEERRTAGVVRRELKEAGVAYVDDLAGGTGVLAHLPGRAEKSTGLRADMDALPIAEQTGAVYASTTPGIMHACGHDGHTTILIGAARILSGLAEQGELPRPVTFVFQPAEEGGAGGRRMVEEGCLSGSLIGPPVQMMFALHGWPQYPLGVVGTRPGPLLAAADMFEVTVRGTGSHAAFPHLGRDPVVAAAAIISAFQSIAARNVDPLEAVVVSVTRIDGGTTHNIIPDEVSLAGTVRTLTPEVHRITQQRLHDVAVNVAQGLGCEAEVQYHLGYPVTSNDPAAVEVFDEVALSALGSERLQPVRQPAMVGEDFAFYCHAVPSCFFVLGLLPPGEARMPQLHQPTFDFNDDAIATGVELFCRLALRPL